MLSPQEEAWLDQEDAHTAEIIRQHGVYIQSVGGDPSTKEAPFAYTVGLFGIHHPELAIVGLSTGNAGAVLNDVAARVRAGEVLVAGMVLGFGTDWPHRVLVEDVPNPGEIAFAANRYYQRPNEASVPLLQLTYDDRDGRFPTDDGYSNPDWVQPRPGDWRG